MRGRAHRAEHNVRHVTEAAEIVLNLVHVVDVPRQPLNNDAERRQGDHAAALASHQVGGAHAAPQVLQPDDEQLGGNHVEAGVYHGDARAGQARHVAAWLMRL